MLQDCGMFKGLFEPSASAVREAWLLRLSIWPSSMAGAKEKRAAHQMLGDPVC